MRKNNQSIQCRQLRSRHMSRRAGFIVVVMCVLCMWLPSSEIRAAGLILEQSPDYGVQYDKLEPAFYTGFAPRCQDPGRIHLHVGRGNQLRVTVVLSPELLLSYARDLQYRHRTYRRLMIEGKLVLTQNFSFDEFEQVLQTHEIDRLVTDEANMSENAVRYRNLELLERLNPNRIFRIRMPIDTVIDNWLKILKAQDHQSISDDRRLELCNAMLPNRIWIGEPSKIDGTRMLELVRKSIDENGELRPNAHSHIRVFFLLLFSSVSNGYYPVIGDSFVFQEFTAIYPIGTLNDFTYFQGKQIPFYYAPGRRAFLPHQRSKTVDHIPVVEVYSYFPWLPYMHVGSTLHNSFHTLWWRMEMAKTSFIPTYWREAIGNSRTGHALPNLWLLSRGPMSHGCTHVNAGHISELRQVLPSDTNRIYEIDNYRNLSHLYDVFDIVGDFTPEVMGVEYYIAYTLRNNKAFQLRVRDERKVFYQWLYTDELQYHADGRAWFKEVRDARFPGRNAVAGKTYTDIDLYEAAYEPERVQFFKMIDIPFARELRKTAVNYTQGF